MTDIVTVYSRIGKPLAQLPVSVMRTWKLERTVDKAGGSFVIDANNSKATQNLLKDRNLLYIKSDQAGIPDWVGVIIDGNSQNGSALTIKVAAIESIFDDVFTDANTVYSTSAAVMFKFLIELAQTKKYVPIANTQNITEAPDTFYKEYHFQNIYQIMNELADEAGAYWWLSPRISTDNRLELIPYWRLQRYGTSRAIHLAQGANFTDVKIEEPYMLKNRVFAVGKTDNWFSPNFAVSENTSSVATYGAIEHVIYLNDVTDLTTLQAAADRAILELSTPRLVVTGAVISTPFPQVGDEIPVHLSEYGFMVARRANPLIMRVTRATYSPDDNTLAIRAEEIFPGE